MWQYLQLLRIELRGPITGRAGPDYCRLAGRLEICNNSAQFGPKLPVRRACFRPLFWYLQGREVPSVLQPPIGIPASYVGRDFRRRTQNAKNWEFGSVTNQLDTSGPSARDNLAENNQYGFFCSGQGTGTSALEFYLRGYIFQKNVIVGGLSAYTRPATSSLARSARWAF